MKMFDGSPHFFKVMIGDFAQRLCVPPAFAQKLRSEIGKGGNGVLQGPRGMRWNVKLCSTSTRFEFFGGGWENFVHQHAIEFGDFLVFKYICPKYFRVRIFGKNGCEKDIPIFHSEKIQSDCEVQRWCPNLSTANTSTDHLMNRKFSVDLKRKLKADTENEVKKPKLSSHSHPSEIPEHFHPSLTEKKCQIVKSAKTITGERSRRIRCCYVSSRRPVNETEKEKALEAAKSFVSENPFRLVIMKPSMVYRIFRIRTSNTFVDNLKLPRKRTEVTLVDPNKREWPVRFIGDLPKASLTAGWGLFSIGNNLEEGDACIFERVDDDENRIKINVHIFPVVEDCSPYKYIKGGRGNASLASTTKLCKKGKCVKQGIEQLQGEKEKYSNDFSTNLPAKAFGPEKGKCVKQGIEQMQREKEKPSNGSKYINLYKSKCKPSIPERTAGCRRSLRLAQACHLRKCPKKELWDDRNVVILS